MAKEIERYRALVNFRHKFENVNKLLDSNPEISSPKFFARNLPFCLDLHRKRKDSEIYCDLTCEEEVFKGDSFNVQFHYSLITPSKIIHSAELSCTFDYYIYFHKTILSELFPDQEIIVDDTITIEVCLWVDEPKGIIEYQPPKKKLCQELQFVENQVQNNAFASLLDSGDFSDVTFVTNLDSSRIKAHKTILAARSPVFARMLTSNMKEAKENELRIDDMGATSLKIMLRHIYTAQLEFPEGVKIDLKICQELANAGEKYDLKNLKEYAALAMTEFVSFENAWELFVFAKRLKAEAATKALNLFIVENIDKILEKV